MNMRVVFVEDDEDYVPVEPEHLAPYPLVDVSDQRPLDALLDGQFDDVWGISLDDLNSVDTSSAPSWSLGTAPLWVSGDGADIVAAHVARHIVGLHHCGEVHLHVLSQHTILPGFAELPHAGLWCTDGDLSRARRALAVLATELERRVGHHDDFSRVGRQGDGMASLLPLQLIVIHDLARWLHGFAAAHDHVSVDRLHAMIGRGATGGYGVILVDADETVVSPSSTLGLLLSDATRVRTRTRVTQRERAVLATGRVHFTGEPGGGSPVKRPYRLSELPRHVPFAALTPPRVSADGFTLALGLDVDRHVVELQCSTSSRLTVGLGDETNLRRPLIDIVLAGVDKAAIRLLHGNDLFGPLDVPDDGRHVLVIADISTVSPEQFRTVLDWMEIDRTHHVLALGDRAWWTKESVGRLANVIHLDHTRARLHADGRDVEIRLGTPASGISHRR